MALTACEQERIDDLESRVAELEKTVDELQESRSQRQRQLPQAGLLERIEDASEHAKARGARAEVQRLSIAVDEFYLDNGRVPQELAELVERPADARNWNGPYVSDRNLIDPWGRLYQYRHPGQHRSYDIYSYGPGGHSTPESEYIGNWDR